MATTVSQLLTYVELKTQAGTGNLNNALSGLLFLNEALLDFRSELIKRGIDGAQLQESYVPSITPPVSGNGSTFAWPVDMYFLKTVSVNMTSGAPNDYVQARIMDVSNTPDRTSFEWLRNNQPANAPLIDNRGDTFEVFPSFANATNLANAIRILYYLTPTPYSTTADNLTYPDTLDWYILAIKVAEVYYESLNKFEEAAVWEQRYQTRLNKLVTTQAQDSKQPVEPSGLQLTGWNF